MTHVITSLCIREGSCLEACPVECIVAGHPVERWPLYYIDPETCIDCGACANACVYHAIFPQDEVPIQFCARGGEVVSKPEGTPGFPEKYQNVDCNNDPIVLNHTRILKTDEVFDFSDDIRANQNFFDLGPGYSTEK